MSSDSGLIMSIECVSFTFVFESKGTSSNASIFCNCIFCRFEAYDTLFEQFLPKPFVKYSKHFCTLSTPYSCAKRANKGFRRCAFVFYTILVSTLGVLNLQIHIVIANLVVLVFPLVPEIFYRRLRPCFYHGCLG